MTEAQAVRSIVARLARRTRKARGLKSTVGKGVAAALKQAHRDLHLLRVVLLELKVAYLNRKIALPMELHASIENALLKTDRKKPQ